MFKKIWSWLVNSSEDPAKLSLTIKGFLGTAASLLVLVSPLVHMQITSGQVTEVTDLVIQLVVALCGVISAIAAVLGFARKIYLTFSSNPTEHQ